MKQVEDHGLIPGLPEDVALDCIARIRFGSHSKIRPVCKKWRDLLTSPSFSLHRHRLAAAEDLVFFIQAVDRAASGDAKVISPPPCALTLYNATLATWHRIPTPDPVPIFAQVAAADGKVIVLGGWDPVTLDPVADVSVLDLVTMTWRRGRPMSSARSFFACAAGGGRVYVAGGHDESKNALRSAEAYDVAADEWVRLPPMHEERDEAKGAILGGKFWAVSGYKTESQGQFSTSAEWYDVEESEWRKVEGAWDDATCASCFGHGDRMWSLGPNSIGGGEVLREFDFEGKEWKKGVGPALEGMGMTWGTCVAGAVMGEGERVMVTGGEGKGGWVVDLGSMKVGRVEAPVGFLGPVYSAAALRI